MKLNGFVGKGSGKLGSSVFAISGGEQIVREYNPVVSNPNTEAQIAQRAKLKLMSQLAAALAPALGFTKQGLVSARNQFVSKNIDLVSYSENSAEVNVTLLQLTPSNLNFPDLSITSAGESLNVALNAAANGDVKRVAYFLYKQTDDDKLEYVTSKIVTEAGQGRTFPTSFETNEGALVVYAYGIKDNNVNATIRYEDYMSEQGDSQAILSVVAMFRSADYTLTKSVAGTAGI